MKKLLPTLCLSLLLTSAFSQNELIVRYEVWQNPSGGQVSFSQPFWMTVNATNTTYQFQTDSLGWFQDTIPHPGNGSITFVSYDCQGNESVDTRAISTTNTWTGDTAYATCGLQLGCDAMIHERASSGLTVNLQDSSHFNFPSLNYSGHFSQWDFGDGNTAYKWNDLQVSHTYAQPGTYNVCLYSYVKDTLYNVMVCEDTACIRVTVGSSTPPFCEASYWLDTLNSGGSNVYIVNNSTPANSNTAYTTTYSWDFGDGSISTQPYPVHTYSSPGTYSVCLTINSVDANNNVCTDTFCEALGIDSLGNLIYKGAEGFTLSVLDTAGQQSIGVEEAGMNAVNIYPNPAADVVYIDGVGASAYTVKLFDLKGSLIKSVVGNTNRERLQMDLSGLDRGVYLISVETEESMIQQRLVKN